MCVVLGYGTAGYRARVLGCVLNFIHPLRPTLFCLNLDELDF